MTINITIEIAEKEQIKSREPEIENESSGDTDNIVIPKYVLNQADIGDDNELAVCGYNGRIAVVGIYDYDDFDSIAFYDLARDLSGSEYEFFVNLALEEYIGDVDELLYIPQNLLDEAEISPESDLHVYKFDNSVLITEDIYGEDF